MAIVRAHVLNCLSHVWLFATWWTPFRQAPLSLGFSRQEHWSGLPCLHPRDLPHPGIGHASPVATALQADSLPLGHQGSYRWHPKSWNGYVVGHRSSCKKCDPWEQPLGAHTMATKSETQQRWVTLPAAPQDVRRCWASRPFFLGPTGWGPLFWDWASWRLTRFCPLSSLHPSSLSVYNPCFLRASVPGSTEHTRRLAFKT